MDIRESISKLFNLSKNGELKLLPLEEEILETELQSFIEGKNSDKFTYRDFGNFIDGCVVAMEKEGFRVRWSTYYQAVETEGISSNSSLVLGVKKPKNNHQYTGPENIKTYKEVPQLTSVQKLVVDKYKLTQRGTLGLLPFNDSALMFAISEYDKKYKKEEFFYMTYFLWFAEDFCKENEIRVNIQARYFLERELKLTNKDPFSHRSDPKETQIDKLSEEEVEESHVQEKESCDEEKVPFVIGECLAKYLKPEFEGQKETLVSSFKEHHKMKKEQRDQDTQKLRSLLEEDDMDYGSIYNKDNLPF